MKNLVIILFKLLKNNHSSEFRQENAYGKVKLFRWVIHLDSTIKTWAILKKLTSISPLSPRQQPHAVRGERRRGRAALALPDSELDDGPAVPGRDEQYDGTAQPGRGTASLLGSHLRKVQRPHPGGAQLDEDSEGVFKISV